MECAVGIEAKGGIYLYKREEVEEDREIMAKSIVTSTAIICYSFSSGNVASFFVTSYVVY